MANWQSGRGSQAIAETPISGKPATVILVSWRAGGRSLEAANGGGLDWATSRRLVFQIGRTASRRLVFLYVTWKLELQFGGLVGLWEVGFALSFRHA
jgi:hypothetical protein